MPFWGSANTKESFRLAALWAKGLKARLGNTRFLLVGSTFVTKSDLLEIVPSQP
jgi:hypothetical protein